MISSFEIVLYSVVLCTVRETYTGVQMAVNQKMKTTTYNIYIIYNTNNIYIVLYINIRTSLISLM